MTEPPQARDFWVVAIGGDRVMERPKLHGGASVTILAITTAAVQVRTPEGIAGWIREPADIALTSDLSTTGEAARFRSGTSVQIVHPIGIPLRQAPASDSAKLQEHVPPGQEGTVQELRGDWLKLTLNDGTSGWGRWYYDGAHYIQPAFVQGRVQWADQPRFDESTIAHFILKQVSGPEQPHQIAQRSIRDITYDMGVGQGLPFALFTSIAFDSDASYGVSIHVDVDRNGLFNPGDYRAEQPFVVPTQPYLEPVTLSVERVTDQAPAPAPDATATVTGRVMIDPTRPIPPDAVLLIQLHGWPDSRLGGPFVVDEQAITEPEIGPHAFTLEYNLAGAVEHIAGLGTHEVHAEVRAPGRVPWIVTYPVMLQTPPAPVELVIQPPANIGTITGSVTVPAAPVLPQDGELTIRLEPDSGFDGNGVGQLVITPVQPGVIPFLLEYPALAISPEQSFFIHAEVRANGKLPLITPLYPMLTQGNPAEVNAMLSPPTNPLTVSGTASYTAEQQLPADAVLTVRVLDITGADGPEVVVAQQTIKPVVASPVAFALEFNPQMIEASRSYALSAHIKSGQRTLYSSAQLYSVLTGDAPTNVEVVLTPAR